MSYSLGVAELKRRFSEILNRVEMHGESIWVQRHGRRVAVIGPPDNTEARPVPNKPRRGLAAAAGAWEDHPDIDGFIADIQVARDDATDRIVKPFE